jgi:hypothetical protein
LCFQNLNPDLIDYNDDLGFGVERRKEKELLLFFGFRF